MAATLWQRDSLYGPQASGDIWASAWNVSALDIGLAGECSSKKRKSRRAALRAVEAFGLGK